MLEQLTEPQSNSNNYNLHGTIEQPQNNNNAELNYITEIERQRVGNYSDVNILEVVDETNNVGSYNGREFNNMNFEVNNPEFRNNNGMNPDINNNDNQNYQFTIVNPQNNNHNYISGASNTQSSLGNFLPSMGDGK